MSIIIQTIKREPLLSLFYFLNLILIKKKSWSSSCQSYILLDWVPNRRNTSSLDQYRHREKFRTTLSSGTSLTAVADHSTLLHTVWATGNRKTLQPRNTKGKQKIVTTLLALTYSSYRLMCNSYPRSLAVRRAVISNSSHATSVV